MLLTVAMGLVLQAPQDMKDWVDRGYDGTQPNSAVVAGTPELSRSEAWRSASLRAIEQRQDQLKAFASARLAVAGDSWIPDFVTQQAVRAWSGEQMEGYRLRVLDRDLLVRNHGFGQSFQAFLLLDRGVPGARHGAQALEQCLADARAKFTFQCGGVLGWWGLMALLAFWLDRLTRGYMTGRLFVLGSGLALLAPILLVIS